MGQKGRQVEQTRGAAIQGRSESTAVEGERVERPVDPGGWADTQQHEDTRQHGRSPEGRRGDVEGRYLSWPGRLPTGRDLRRRHAG